MSPAELAALHASAFDKPWSEVEFAALLRQTGVFAASEPGGFILVRQVADEAEILTLAVEPAGRRRGLGRRLTEQAAAQAAQRGAAKLFLEVAIDNPAAIALYRACGFRELGLRRGYYSRVESAIDALVLGRDL
ncbi:MAG: ribosomal-protein-alanine acetyltransferase [Caulobacteraceae bacterium]|nr:ribosomal-protein-alanine acetyltransferase [Caulobacteraceae bacterium]